MNISLAFTRSFFVLLSVFFMTTYMLSRPNAEGPIDFFIGIGIGAAFAVLLFAVDIAFRRFNLRSFNVAMIGLFIGYLMGGALLLIFNRIVSIGNLESFIQPKILEITRIGIFLFTSYLGTLMTLRAADELHISIPFVRFASTMHKKKDLLIDLSSLYDPRLYDLCTTGIFDEHLVIPQFIVKELYAQAEGNDESIRIKAKKTLEYLKKLQSLEMLALRFNETDFPEALELQCKMIRLAKLLDCNILAADASRLQMPGNLPEQLRVISLSSLSNALKPMMQSGELLRIKIQRIGKEPRQGVGYLDDGTMVVVNGGGSFLGDMIDTKVLSVKHTTSGRMIFCNAIDGDLTYREETAEEAFDEQSR